MLTLSRVLRSTAEEVFVDLFEASNEHIVNVDHLLLTYTGNGQFVECLATARTLGLDGQPGRYTGSKVYTYRRESLQVLLGGVVDFLFAVEFPFTFQTLSDHLKGAYGLVIEAQDVLQFNGSVMTPTTVITDTEAVNGIVSLNIAPNSPRFILGDTLNVKVLSPNGGDLSLLGPTALLLPETTMDG